ncbi:MAG: hypothetical protein QXW79_00420 [Thermoplasmata archaeon]
MSEEPKKTFGSTLREQLSKTAGWKGRGEEVKSLKKYFSMTSWQYLVILGIAITGLASFINTYNAFSDINIHTEKCYQEDPLNKEIHTQFVVVLVLSILSLVLGITLAILLRHAKNQRRIVTLGIITVGIFGIIYSLSLKFYTFSGWTKVGISWASFVAFLILGFFMSIETPSESEEHEEKEE